MALDVKPRAIIYQNLRVLTQFSKQVAGIERPGFQASLSADLPELLPASSTLNSESRGAKVLPLRKSISKPEMQTRVFV